MSFAGLPNFGKMGVNLTASGGSIRVYSANATRVTLCILDADNPSLTVSEIELARYDDEIWFAESSNIKAGIKYVLRADGPSGPRHSFNPEIDLIDPYARGVVRENARDYHCVAVSQPSTVRMNHIGAASPRVSTSRAKLLPITSLASTSAACSRVA